VTLLSSVLALWNYDLAPISAQIRSKDSISALRVYWLITHWVNDPNFGTTVWVMCLFSEEDLGLAV